MEGAFCVCALDRNSDGARQLDKDGAQTDQHAASEEREQDETA